MTERVVNLGACLDIARAAIERRKTLTPAYARAAVRTAAEALNLERDGPEVGYIEALMQDAADARAVVAVNQPGAIDGWVLLEEAITELENAEGSDLPEPTR